MARRPQELSTQYRAPVFIDEDTSTVSKVGLALNTPYGYREHPGNILHTVDEGDTWSYLAFKYYKDLGESYPGYSAARLYRFVAMFQPVPAVDPTILLQPGLTVVIPSVSLLTAEVLGG